MTTATKRLTLDISPQTHRRLKTLASYGGITMKEFVLSRALPMIEASYTADETAYLLKGQKNKGRLLSAVHRKGKGGRAFVSLKELKHALGI